MRGWTVGALLLMSLMSGLSTPVGAALVTGFRRIGPGALAVMLGIASGVMGVVTAADLLPLSIREGGVSLACLGAAVGLTGMWALHGQMARGGSSSDQARFRIMGWFVAVAMALHDLPEGMAIGAGNMVGVRVGVVIALAIALHNVPEGMSIAAPLRMGGVPPARILVATAAIGLVTPLGTLVALVLGAISPDSSAVILALAAGAMTYVVSHDTLPESLRASWPAALVGIALGSLLMLGVHVYFGM